MANEKLQSAAWRFRFNGGGGGAPALLIVAYDDGT